MAGCYDSNNFFDRHFENQLMRHLAEEDEDTCYLLIKDKIIETAKKGHFEINRNLSDLIDELIETILLGGCQDCKENNPEFYEDCERPLK